MDVDCCRVEGVLREFRNFFSIHTDRFSPFVHCTSVGNFTLGIGALEVAIVPVITVLSRAIHIAWENAGRFSSALGPSTLVLVAIWAAETVIVREASWTATFLTWFVYIFGFSIFAVVCHRLILVEHEHASFRLRLSARELKFAAWVVILSAAFALATWCVLIVAVNLPFVGNALLQGYEYGLLTPCISVPLFYLFARSCLVLPGAAVDDRIGLRTSWKLTQGNGWRVAIVVGLYPWLIEALLLILERDDPYLLEQVATGLLWYIGLALEVFVLSVTYQFLTARPGEEPMHG